MTASAPTITLKGNPLPLAGALPQVGQNAPNAELVNNDLAPVQLESFRGKVLVLSSVPSLDTPICDMETRRFNQEAEKLGERVQIITISMDLPFAQKRWCGAAGIERVLTLSDYRAADFGTKYGVLIPAIRLLARAVFVVDAAGVIRYVQLVPEVGQEPEYGPILQAVKALL
ncbi:thiol peroxidase [Desulfatirhabdium butyrativorans]|uniref:thiol peroxidase n=1 Tax=Desulfatirhabdium butyrativorans TaxID=340467 RepID=UPI000413EEC6|nr:thiol peroxidase [Desulfatirhabdium butyrativorans]